MLTKYRKELSRFCDSKRTCDNCILEGAKYRCGRGTHFTFKKNNDQYDMSDEEIIRIYKTVFNKDITIIIDNISLESLNEFLGN